MVALILDLKIKVSYLAKLVQKHIPTKIKVYKSDDIRSYRISSEKLFKVASAQCFQPRMLL